MHGKYLTSKPNTPIRHTPFFHQTHPIFHPPTNSIPLLIQSQLVCDLDTLSIPSKTLDTTSLIPYTIRFLPLDTSYLHHYNSYLFSLPYTTRLLPIYTPFIAFSSLHNPFGTPIHHNSYPSFSSLQVVEVVYINPFIKYIKTSFPLICDTRKILIRLLYKI